MDMTIAITRRSFLSSLGVFAAAVLIPVIVSAIYGSVTEKRKEREAEIKKAAAKAAKIKAKRPNKPAKRLD